MSLSEETEMLFDRHLDVLILCTIFAIIRLHSLEPVSELWTFNQIIELYKEVYYYHDQESHNKILLNIKLEDGTGFKYKNRNLNMN